MPQTMVKHTTVYTLDELKQWFPKAYDTAIEKVLSWSWEDFEPTEYSDSIASFVEENYPVFDMNRTSLEWSTNPNRIKASGSIDVVAYMKAHKLCNKLRALYTAITYYDLERTVRVSFGMGEDTDLNDVERGVDYNIDGMVYQSLRYCKIMDQLNALELHIDNYMSGIESKLLANLSKEIDWQWSAECAKEAIEANDFVFTEDGDIYH